MYGDSERAKAFFEPPRNTEEHRLTADKEKAYKGGFGSSFIVFLLVFIGVNRCESVAKESFRWLFLRETCDASICE